MKYSWHKHATLIEVVVQRAVARAGGGAVTGTVAVGRQRDVTVPACLQTHLLCKHLHRSKASNICSHTHTHTFIAD